MSYLARRNVTRRRFRTVVTVFSLILMIGFIFASQLFTQGVGYGLKVGTERMGADIIVAPIGTNQSALTYLLTGKPAAFYMNASVLQQVRDLPFVAQASPQLFLTTLSKVSSSSSGELEVVGIDPQTDFTILPWLTKPLTSSLGNNQLVIGSGISSGFDDAKLFGQNFSHVGQLFPTGLGLDNSVFITISEAEHIIQLNSEGQLPTKLPITILPGEISVVTVKLKPGTDFTYASYTIQESIKGVTTVTASDMQLTLEREMSGLLQSISLFALAVWGIALVVIGSVFSMSVNERRREIGLMRAIGFTRRYIYGLVTAEGTSLTIIGGSLGVCAGVAAVYIFNGVMSKATQLSFYWPSQAQILLLVAESIGLSVLIGVAASAIPAYTSSRMEPYSAIRQE